MLDLNDFTGPQSLFDYSVDNNTNVFDFRYSDFMRFQQQFPWTNDFKFDQILTCRTDLNVSWKVIQYTMAHFVIRFHMLPETDDSLTDVYSNLLDKAQQ